MANHCYNYASFEGSKENIRKAAKEIKKAIAALEILAEDGDEDARKGIEALKILLN
jgi:hypothetical protein